MPDDYLASLDPIERGRLWTENLRAEVARGAASLRTGKRDNPDWALIDVSQRSQPDCDDTC